MKHFQSSILSDGKQAKVAAKDIGDKVQVVIDGALGLSTRLLKTLLTPIFSDSNHARVAAQETRFVIQQVANDMDEIKCS